MVFRFKKLIFLFVFFLLSANIVFAESLNQKTAQIYLSPRQGSFTVGSSFEVGVYIDTKGESINTIDLKINFDSKKLSIAKPSSGTSIFGIWTTNPTYDNTSGTLSMNGIVPNGIVTNAGLITTITFKVLQSGDTNINIAPSTAAYLNDGSGSKANLSLGRGTFSLKNIVSEGVNIYSNTHQFSDNWYNNNNPVFTWENSKESFGYSLVFDSNPNTVPDNNITTNKNTSSFEKIADGMWYLHVKSKEQEGFSNTSVFKIKIDTTPPIQFKPTINKIKGEGRDEYLLLFKAEDILSGISHYEVGILDPNRDKNTLPVFVQTESPYVVPSDGSKNIKMIVKAYDNAGNVREAATSLYPDRTNYYILFGFLILLLLFVLHYLFSHHIAYNIKRAFSYFKAIQNKDDINNNRS